MIILIWICIGLAALIWPFVIALNFDLTGSDAAGNGIAQGLAVLGTISVWSLLAVALLIAGLRGLIPVWSLLIAFVLVPLSGYAAGNAIEVLADQDAQWLTITVIAVPPLLALYLAWAIIPSFHAAFDPKVASIGVWISIAVLAALPWPQIIALPGIQQKRIDDWQAHRDALFAKFNDLATNGSVEGWWHFLDIAEDQRDAALQQIRTHLDRQPKIEALLQAGDGSGFPMLYDMELTPDASLCAAAQAFLQQRIPTLKPASPTASYYEIRDKVEPYGQTLHWLAENHCPLKAELDQLEAVIRSYADPDNAILFLKDLDEIRGGPAQP